MRLDILSIPRLRSIDTISDYDRKRLSGKRGNVSMSVSRNQPVRTFEANDIDLRDVALRIVFGWKLTALLVIGAIVCAAMYLRYTEPTYTAELRVTPAASSPATAQGALSRIGGIASLAGMALDSGGNGATPFELYLDAVLSREVATELAEDPKIMQTVFASEWDAGARRWREPENVFSSLLVSIKSLMGIDTHWVPPSAARLQQHLVTSLSIVRGTKEPISLLAYDHADPAFAVYMLRRLNEIADAKIRRVSLRRATLYVAYLSQRIPTVTVAEHRDALIGNLAEQERAIMMTSANVPYAAVALEEPTASLAPTAPKPSLVLAIALGGALLIGSGIALLRSSPAGEQ